MLTNFSVPSRNRSQLALESLERRALLCGIPHESIIEPPQWSDAIEQQYAGQTESPDAVSIVWTNRGQASDNFTATFGTSAPAARAVIDAVLSDWARVITSFNRNDGTSTLQVNVSIANNGFGGGGAPAATAPSDGRPRTGSFTLGAGNPVLFPSPDDSNGWYFDANPNDHAEFNGPITSAYAGNAPGGINNDFYSVASAELLHVLGLVSDMNNNGGAWQGYLLEASGMATNTGIADTTDGGGTFWTFDGPTVDHLLTSFNGGGSWGNVVHAAGPGADIDFAGRNWRGSASTGNGRGNGGRVIPDFPMAHMLADAYGYSIVEPFAFDTFHYLLNRQTGELLIRGMTGNGNSADVITVGRSGNFISVSVDVGNDTAGTGALPGAGNLPAFTALFDSSEVDSITIAAMDGNDTINLDGMFANIPVLIDGGFGNDTINLTPAGDNLDLLSSQLTVQGNDGTGDVLVLHDTANAFGDTFTITNSSVDRDVILPINYNSLEEIRINAGAGGATFNVNSLFAAVDLTISAGGGADIFNVGPVGGNFDVVDGEVSLFGQGNGASAGDTVNINDATHAANSTYTMTSIDLTRAGAGRINWGTIEGVFLNAGSGANVINVNSTPGGTGTTINAGGGADTVNVGLSAATVLTVNGGDANDTVNLNNVGSLSNLVVVNGNAGTGDTLNYNAQNSSANDVYDIASGSIGRTATIDIFHGTFENVVVNAGVGSDRFDVETTAAGTTYAFNGNLGNDALDVTFSSGALGNADGPIVFNGDAGSDTASLFDNLSVANDSYTITATQITRAGFGGLTYGTAEGVALTCSGGANVINVNSTAAGTPVTVNAGNGSDAFNVATGDFDGQIRGNLVLNGGAGAEFLFLDDDTDGLGSDIYTVQNNTMSKFGSGVVTWNQTETVQVNGSNNADLYEILSNVSGVSLTIDGNGGNDQFQLGAIGTGNLNSLPGALTLNGLGGTGDTVTIHDSGSSASDNYTLTSTSLTHPSFGGMTYGGIEGITLNASSGANVIDVRTAGGCPVTLNAAAGTDTINVNETAAGAPVNLLASTGNDAVRVNPDAAGSVAAHFTQTQRIGQLSVFNGGTATITAGGSKVLTMSSIGTTGNGVLDMTDNDAIVDYTGASPLSAIGTLVATGYNGGNWLGNGAIRSSSAASAGNTGIGIAEATDLFSTFPATFAGQSVDNTAVLLKYTAYGDANLDGQVNLSDFNRLASNFGQSGRRWVHGDVNYDGTVNLTDFNRLAANFGATGFGATTSVNPDDLLEQIV